MAKRANASGSISWDKRRKRYRARVTVQTPSGPERKDLGYHKSKHEAQRVVTEALVEYEATLAKEPNRFRATYGAARAAGAVGQPQKAATHYASLVALAEKADQPLRKEVVEARKVAH